MRAVQLALALRTANTEPAQGGGMSACRALTKLPGRGQHGQTNQARETGLAGEADKVTLRTATADTSAAAAVVSGLPALLHCRYCTHCRLNWLRLAETGISRLGCVLHLTCLACSGPGWAAGRAALASHAASGCHGLALSDSVASHAHSDVAREAINSAVCIAGLSDAWAVYRQHQAAKRRPRPVEALVVMCAFHSGHRRESATPTHVLAELLLVCMHACLCRRAACAATIQEAARTTEDGRGMQCRTRTSAWWTELGSAETPQQKRSGPRQVSRRPCLLCPVLQASSTPDCQTTPPVSSSSGYTPCILPPAPSSPSRPDYCIP